MNHLILVRHGNTFESGQTPTYVGGRTDMPLTVEGERQGMAIADKLVTDYPSVSAITSGPLQRTKKFAEIFAHKYNSVFTVDERLTEIDYGFWENKTMQVVETLYGKEVISAWDNEGTWPEDMNWAPSMTKVTQNVQALLAEQHKKMTEGPAHHRIIVTSNGILRFFYKIVTGQTAGKDAKVKTGHYCILLPTETGWEITGWNLSA